MRIDVADLLRFEFRIAEGVFNSELYACAIFSRMRFRAGVSAGVRFASS